MLRYINSLGEETAKIIKEQLDMIYFMPVIEHIKSIREEYGYSYWDTVTDRGVMPLEPSVFCPPRRACRGLRCGQNKGA